MLNFRSKLSRTGFWMQIKISKNIVFSLNADFLAPLEMLVHLDVRLCLQKRNSF